MNQLCKVCGEPAAGYHFGAFTCEGCKSFFGRTYSNLGALGECKNNGNCVINKKNRTSCKSCRLKKCLMVGMSKSGSRYGRRSNWFKIHCLIQDQQELKSKLEEAGSESGRTTVVPSPPSISSSDHSLSLKKEHHHSSHHRSSTDRHSSRDHSSSPPKLNGHHHLNSHHHNSRHDRSPSVDRHDSHHNRHERHHHSDHHHQKSSKGDSHNNNNNNNHHHISPHDLFSSSSILNSIPPKHLIPSHLTESYSALLNNNNHLSSLHSTSPHHNSLMRDPVKDFLSLSSGKDPIRDLRLQNLMQLQSSAALLRNGGAGNSSGSSSSGGSISGSSIGSSVAASAAAAAAAAFNPASTLPLSLLYSGAFNPASFLTGASGGIGSPSGGGSSSSTSSLGGLGVGPFNPHFQAAAAAFFSTLTQAAAASNSGASSTGGISIAGLTSGAGSTSSPKSLSSPTLSEEQDKPIDLSIKDSGSSSDSNDNK